MYLKSLPSSAAAHPRSAECACFYTFVTSFTLRGLATHWGGGRVRLNDLLSFTQRERESVKKMVAVVLLTFFHVALGVCEIQGECGEGYTEYIRFPHTLPCATTTQ